MLRSGINVKRNIREYCTKYAKERSFNKVTRLQRRINTLNRQIVAAYKRISFLQEKVNETKEQYDEAKIKWQARREKINLRGLYGNLTSFKKEKCSTQKQAQFGSQH